MKKGFLMGLMAAGWIALTGVSGLCANPKATKPKNKALGSTSPKITKELVKEVEPVGNFLWLVLKDGKEYLVSSDGRFVIKHPELYDMRKKVTIRSFKQLRLARRPDVDKYAFFYLYKAGKPKALIVVDEYCPFCERLMSDVITLLKSGRKPKYDLAVTFFPIHRQAIDASCKLMGVSPEKAKEIYVKWVETRDASVWNGLTCNPQEKQNFLIKAAGLRFESGINATPAVILPDGRKVIGYRNPEEFLFVKRNQGGKK